MAVYLIDYENVSFHGFAGLNTLSENAELLIFYTENADKLTFALHEQLLNAKAAVRLIKTEAAGKNALDFQLSTYLGYLIARAPDATYYIVSKDAGFSPIIRFWSGRGVDLRQISDLTAGTQSQFEKQLAGLLGDAGLSREIAELVSKYKTKQGINNALVKKYGAERAYELYKKVKPLLSDKKGN
jgi:hypothetical protein